MGFVRVAWLYGPDVRRPLIPPTVADLVSAIELLGTPAAHTLELYSRLNLDRTNDQEMTVLGWSGRFHIRVVDNNVSEEEVYCFRGGQPGATGTFMFPVEADFDLPNSEVLTDRAKVQQVVLAFFEAGFTYDEAQWTLYAPE